MRLLKNLKSISHLKPKKNVIVLKTNISYKTFWELCCNLANYLKRNNFSRICILEDNEKDYLSYVSMFATLLSGGTYIPVNNATPKKRLQHILKISNTTLLISKNKILLPSNIVFLSKRKIETLKKIKTFKIQKSNKDAYIIFTSGSTGLPKGVRISRKSLDHYVSWITKKFFNDENIRCSQQPGIGFDLSVADIYGTICSGGTLYPVKDSYDKFFLNKFIKKNNLTHWVSVPSAIDLIYNKKFFEKNDLLSVKKMFFCGEILKKIHLEKIFNHNKEIQVLNTYGPTEATVSCTEIFLDKNNFKKYSKPNVSIGKSIKNMNIGLTNKINNFEGELYISGPQLSLGYLNNQNLNKSKFIFLKKKRIFLTGDICKYEKGNYYFLHRSDRQIKILGNRIELNEIDNIFSEIFKETSYSIVIKNNIITFTDKKFNYNQSKKKLSQYLPDYMLPKEILKISNWPRNRNFKIDEKKLIQKYVQRK